MTVRLLVGDVRDRIREIPDGSVDLVVTSPPFLALRKYGDNPNEMGSEGTPADFLDALLNLTLEFRRVLAPHGSIAVELGDTYSGSGGAGGDYGDGGIREGQPKFKTLRRKEMGAPDWPMGKSLVLAPGLYAASLAYGRNLINPAHTFTPWRVRNIITWCRPNPPVGALGDKVRPATSYITVACTSGKRYFDLDAVRTEQDYTNNRTKPGTVAKRESARVEVALSSGAGWTGLNPAGAPPLDWWDDALDPEDPTDHLTIVMPTQPYPGAHYATWPSRLAQRLIDMMCPLRVCRECGKPSERIVGEAEYVQTRTGKTPAVMKYAEGERVAEGVNGWDTRGKGDNGASRVAPTLGWSDCGHNNWRPGHVLDPFAGSGTTLAVAQGMGRDATGIELYPANADLIAQRVGMFLEVVA